MVVRNGQTSNKIKIIGCARMVSIWSQSITTPSIPGSPQCIEFAFATSGLSITNFSNCKIVRGQPNGQVQDIVTNKFQVLVRRGTSFCKGPRSMLPPLRSRHWRGRAGRYSTKRLRAQSYPGARAYAAWRHGSRLGSQIRLWDSPGSYCDKLKNLSVGLLWMNDILLLPIWCLPSAYFPDTAWYYVTA